MFSSCTVYSTCIPGGSVTVTRDLSTVTTSYVRSYYNTDYFASSSYLSTCEFTYGGEPSNTSTGNALTGNLFHFQLDLYTPYGTWTNYDSALTSYVYVTFNGGETIYFYPTSVTSNTISFDTYIPIYTTMTVEEIYCIVSGYSNANPYNVRATGYLETSIVSDEISSILYDIYANTGKMSTLLGQISSYTSSTASNLITANYHLSSLVYNTDTLIDYAEFLYNNTNTLIDNTNELVANTDLTNTRLRMINSNINALGSSMVAQFGETRSVLLDAINGNDSDYEEQYNQMDNVQASANELESQQEAFADSANENYETIVGDSTSSLASAFSDLGDFDTVQAFYNRTFSSNWIGVIISSVIGLIFLKYVLFGKRG